MPMLAMDIAQGITQSRCIYTVELSNSSPLVCRSCQGQRTVHMPGIRGLSDPTTGLEGMKEHTIAGIDKASDSSRRFVIRPFLCVSVLARSRSSSVGVQVQTPIW